MGTTILSSVQSTTNNWWISILLGILYIFVGLWVFRTPLGNYISLTIIFSVFIFVSGIMEIAFAISNKNEIDGWGWYLTGGILDLVIGILLISNPIMTMAILPFYVGFWLLFRAMIAIGISIQLKTMSVPNWDLMLASGIVTIIFSFLVLINPFFGGHGIIYMTTIAFIMIGIFKIFLGFDLKGMHKGIRGFQSS